MSTEIPKNVPEVADQETQVKSDYVIPFSNTPNLVRFMDIVRNTTVSWSDVMDVYRDNDILLPERGSEEYRGFLFETYINVALKQVAFNHPEFDVNLEHPFYHWNDYISKTGRRGNLRITKYRMEDEKLIGEKSIEYDQFFYLDGMPVIIEQTVATIRQKVDPEKVNRQVEPILDITGTDRLGYIIMTDTQNIDYINKEQRHFRENGGIIMSHPVLNQYILRKGY